MRNAMTLAALLLTALIAAGCDQEGPAERAGEAMDNAVNDAVDDVREGSEEARDAIEDAADEIDE